MGVESGFRDLFCELPAAVFDTLKDLGEASVSMSIMRDGLRLGRPAIAEYQWGARVYVMERFGWTHVVVARCATDLAIEIVGYLKCGHRQRVSIDERFMIGVRAADVSRFVMAINEAIVTGRSCYCVQGAVA